MKKALIQKLHASMLVFLLVKSTKSKYFMRQPSLQALKALNVVLMGLLSKYIVHSTH